MADEWITQTRRNKKGGERDYTNEALIHLDQPKLLMNLCLNVGSPHRIQDLEEGPAKYAQPTKSWAVTEKVFDSL